MRICSFLSGLRINQSAVLFLVTATLAGCCGGPTSPAESRAIVTIAVSPDPWNFYFDMQDRNYHGSGNAVFTETNGVAVTVLTVKMEFLITGLGYLTMTAAGGILPAHGTLFCPCNPVIPEGFTEMRLSCIGTDANGNAVNVTRTYPWNIR